MRTEPARIASEGVARDPGVPDGLAHGSSGSAESGVASPRSLDTAIALLLAFLACLLLAFCATFLVRNHELVGRLFHAASLAHHERMSAPLPGRAVFYLWHDDPESLPAFVAREPGALDVASAGPEGLVAVTFAAPDDPAVTRLRKDPAVSLMVNRDTALLCR